MRVLGVVGLTMAVAVAPGLALAKAGAYEAGTRQAIARIKAQEDKLHAVIALNPNAVADAKAVDVLKASGKDLGPLMGVPILIKDNIETKDPMATTAGSLALKDNVTGRDAPVVARLRAAGAIILGKTNLSEWANIRSGRSMSGWSAVGGLVGNAHDPARSACGSSSGSGAAVAAGYVSMAVGTETDGSVVCPASMNGIVGLKPTLGLVSRTYVVPISHSQDTPGPMTKTVFEAALMLNAMAGSDPADPATAEADQHRIDYTAGLKPGTLKGLRIGIWRDKVADDVKLKAVFNVAVELLKKEGAVLVEIEDKEADGAGEAEFFVLLTELKADLNAYLATTPAAIKTRTLADIIDFNKAHAAEEMPFFGQETFEQAEATEGLKGAAYLMARDKAATLSRTFIDGALKAYNVSVLIAPTMGPAWLSDQVYGDMYEGKAASGAPARAGYPHLTVPMGAVQGLPVGLSFIGPKWSEDEVLKAGYGFEQARQSKSDKP